MQNSFELLCALKKAGYLKSRRDPLWWPRSGSFEVVIGTLLTQQSRWKKVEESLENLKRDQVLSMEALADASEDKIALLIKPSGFYHTKAQRLILLSQNILKDFGSFEHFAKNVQRAWLLKQKGIGMESADSILCYACLRPVFVVDSYTHRLLAAMGFTFESYEALQEWMQQGLDEHMDKIKTLYGEKIDLTTVYARFHGKIVEYAKDHIRGQEVDIKPLL